MFCSKTNIWNTIVFYNCCKLFSDVLKHLCHFTSQAAQSVLYEHNGNDNERIVHDVPECVRLGVLGTPTRVLNRRDQTIVIIN